MLEICWQGLTPAELPERVLGGSLGSLDISRSRHEGCRIDGSRIPQKDVVPILVKQGLVFVP